MSIVHREAGTGFSMQGGTLQQLPLVSVPGAEGLWALQLRMPGWDKAFFNYQVASASGAGTAAPAFPVEATHLSGVLVRALLHSDRLGEDRRVTVYLPPGRAAGALPALFMVDGQECEAFARVLEPLMQAGKTRPFAIIGVHAAVSPLDAAGTDRRMREYLPGAAPEAFERHMQFFAEELLP